MGFKRPLVRFQSLGPTKKGTLKLLISESLFLVQCLL
jgi:hypothetical protein